MLFRAQVMPGVLKCRHRSCKLPRHGLDPRIARYITEAGFEGLFKVPNLEVDHTLITAMVERWCPETHTFHLPHGEMGITLQGIEVMLGVLVDGLPVTGSVRMDWPGLCHQLLGHRPPDPIPHPHQNMYILAEARIRVSWLKARFRGPLAADATDEVVQQHARYHILAWLESILFMDKSADRVSVMPLQFLNPINNAKRYSWGSGGLAWLYKPLCKTSETKAKQIGGALMLVQLWAYSRFPLICPVTRPPQPSVEAGPLASRYVI
ncbi:serine/threonine-protein phosphatase 7 long form homolog [Castanea sativa]|uniref:serine/threonine-protein phosphatase 7 long form homolog n=1 Tax=Castanea sativa TaxID=21020 RepID=UPI003F653E3E